MNTSDTPTIRQPKISRKWIALILSLVIGIASLWGYYWAKSQGWSYIDQSNSGLISNYTNVLAIDDQEDVWVGTQQGLSVLGPGGKWTNYLEGERILALVTDSQGQTWVGTEGGLSVFSPDSGWKTYTTANSGLTDNAILSLAVNIKGQVWIGTPLGLNLFSAHAPWRVFTTRNSKLPDDTIMALAVDSQDRIWIGTENGLCVITPDGQWKTYTESNSDLAGDYISTLAIDAEGNIWAGSGFRGKGLSVLSPDGEWRVYTRSNSDLGSNDVTALAFDSQGSLWVGSHTKELRVLTPDGQWKRYTKINSGMMDVYIDTLAYEQPSPGALWMGTSYDGIAVYQPAESLPQSIILGLLLIALLCVTSFIIQSVIYFGLAWEKKRQKKPVSAADDRVMESTPVVPESTPTVPEPVPAALEPAPSAPQTVWTRKGTQFAIGFLGWYLVNGLIWLVFARDGFDLEGSGILNLCLLPLNLVVLLVFSRKSRTRFIGLGILSALAVNLFVSLVLGLATNAGCFIPFFIEM